MRQRYPQGTRVAGVGGEGEREKEKEKERDTHTQTETERLSESSLNSEAPGQET